MACPEGHCIDISYPAGPDAVCTYELSYGVSAGVPPDIDVSRKDTLLALGAPVPSTVKAGIFVGPGLGLGWTIELFVKLAFVPRLLNVKSHHNRFPGGPPKDISTALDEKLFVMLEIWPMLL